MDIVCFPGVLVEEVPRTNRQRIMLEFAELHHVLYVEPPKLPLLQGFKAVGRVMPEQRSMKWFVLGYEIEVARQFATLVGYGDAAWGHLTSGGTVKARRGSTS
jgi:hypothetical protein